MSVSTISQMTFPFEAKRGNPMMKSIEIESHFNVKISKGHNSHVGR